jgi:hypothetical protein
MKLSSLVLVGALATAIAFVRVKQIQAQSSYTLTLGNLSLTLGMSQATVLGKLGDDYRLDKVTYEHGSDTDSWVVSQKVQPFNVIGIVSFQDEKLMEIKKARFPSPSGEKTTGIETLLLLMSELDEDVGRSCSVFTLHKPVSGGSLFTGFIVCKKHRSIQISILTHPGSGNYLQQSESVDEVLSLATSWGKGRP